MLEACFEQYEIYSDPTLSLSLRKLSNIAFNLYPDGYTEDNKHNFHLSYDQIKDLFRIYHKNYPNILIQEIFRYAVIFGIVRDVIISPYHIEWNMNPYHQRDLFFTTLKLKIRESHKKFFYYQ